MGKKGAETNQNCTGVKKIKEKGKKIKRWGAVILLFAFVTQNLLMDHLNSKIAKRFEGYQAYSLAYNSNLLYQNLYFNQAQTTGVADGNLLKKAARDNIAGLGVEIVYSDIPKKEKTRKINVLKEEANKVVDLDSFNTYMTKLNEEESDYRQQAKGKYAQAVGLKKGAYLLYLTLYSIGSFLLIRSIKYE